MAESPASWGDVTVELEAELADDGQRDVAMTVELASEDPADPPASVGVGAVVPVARATADDRTPVVVVLYVDEDGGLQVGAADLGPPCLRGRLARVARRWTGTVGVGAAS